MLLTRQPGLRTRVPFRSPRTTMAARASASPSRLAAQASVTVKDARLAGLRAEMVS